MKLEMDSDTTVTENPENILKHKQIMKQSNEIELLNNTGIYQDDGSGTVGENTINVNLPKSKVSDDFQSNEKSNPTSIPISKNIVIIKSDAKTNNGSLNALANEAEIAAFGQINGRPKSILKTGSSECPTPLDENATTASTNNDLNQQPTKGLVTKKVTFALPDAKYDNSGNANQRIIFTPSHFESENQEKKENASKFYLARIVVTAITKMKRKYSLFARKWKNSSPVVVLSGREDSQHIWVTATTQGFRRYQEDRFLTVNLFEFLRSKNIEIPEHVAPIYIYGVLDGHGIPEEGHLVSDYCETHLTNFLLKEFTSYEDETDKRLARNESIRSIPIESFPKFTPQSLDLLIQTINDPKLLEQGITKGFRTMDKRLRLYMPKVAFNNGTTVSMCVLQQNRASFANLGDSRSIFGICGQPEELLQTLDHKPTVDSERTRIIAAGGRVFQRRVNGDLAVSRTLGDLMYKPRGREPNNCLIQCEPEIEHVALDQDDNAEFYYTVIGSDGFWDVFDTEEVAYVVGNTTQNIGTMSNEEAKVLISCLCKDFVKESMIKRRSNDNITVQIIVFPKSKLAETKVSTV